MERITIDNAPGAAEEAIISADRQKKRLARGFLNNAGIFVGLFLMIAVIVIVTTDISITSFEELASLGLDFFLLMFCSYSMYLNCSDSGKRNGLTSHTYTNIYHRYEECKKQLDQVRLCEFCRYYIEDELRHARMSILLVAGIPYETYRERWLAKNNEAVHADVTLSKTQKDAICKANALCPIKLTPEMIIKRGRGSTRRSPLGITPERKKGISFVIKFFSNIVTAMLMSIIVLDVVIEPSWVIFATVMLKLLTVVMNGVAGYKLGYENIVIDTANYMADQIDLMEQAMKYFQAHPKESEKAAEA